MLYSVFGLNLDTELPLRAMRGGPRERPDVVVTIESMGSPVGAARHEDALCYQSSWIDESTGTPGLIVYRSSRDGAFRMRYTDGAEFAIDGRGRQIVCRIPPNLTAADVASYLTGPVLGFVLRIRGVVALHASAVEICDNDAVLLVGPACAGKSTTAAAFATMGHKVITEDIAALPAGDDLRVCAGCAEIALRPDAAEWMYGSPDALPRFSDGWDKRRLDLIELEAFSAAPVPIRAVYLLTNTPTVSDAPCVMDTSPAEAMVELLANVYGNRLLHDDLRVRELDAVHRIVSGVPVKIAATGAEPRLVPRFCEVLVNDLS